jgi:ribose 1,5-bisphosphokinase
MTGRLVYVMGPSGAGKDTVLAYARARLAGSGVLFAHRYITRAPVAGDENFVALSPDEFDERQRRGLFAFSWEAHGCRYGIGSEAEAWQRGGATVVVSGSRAHFRTAAIPDAVAILVTAAPEIRAERLARRGREAAEAVRARLDRAEAAEPSFTIDNSGPLDQAGEALVELLRRIRAGDTAL